LGGREVREKAFQEEFQQPCYKHYLLKYKGVSCSTACMFREGEQARLESVATLEPYRGKGLIGYLIQFIQSDIRKDNIQNLWVFPITKQVQKIYEKYGFETLGTIQVDHALLS
jgi:N-acetylglutamate synthase-like GNAT family acetyltransferase